MLTFDDIAGLDELCLYCPIPEELQGVHCYGGEPIMCEGSYCSDAYERYLEEGEEDD